MRGRTRSDVNATGIASIDTAGRFRQLLIQFRYSWMPECKDGNASENRAASENTLDETLLDETVSQ